MRIQPASFSLLSLNTLTIVSCILNLFKLNIINIERLFSRINQSFITFYISLHQLLGGPLVTNFYNLCKETFCNMNVI